MGLLVMNVLFLPLWLGFSAADAFGGDDDVLLQSRGAAHGAEPRAFNVADLEVSPEELLEEDVALEVEEDAERGIFKKKFWKKAGKAIGGVVNDVVDTVAGGVSDFTRSAVNGIESGWRDVKNTAVKVGDFKPEAFAKTLAKTVTGVASVAQKAINEAKKIDDKVKNTINKVTNRIAGAVQASVDKLGSLAVAFADSLDDAFQAVGGSLKAAFDKMVDFLTNCFDIKKLFCYMVLPSCDCENGSEAWFTGTKLTATCVPAAASEFSKSFGFSTGGNTDWIPDFSTNGAKKLAATDKSPSAKKGKWANKPKTDAAKFKLTSLGNKMVGAPSGSCSAALNLGMDANLEFEPKITAELDVTSGKTTVKVDISITADLTAMIEAQGECEFTAQRRFPRKPITKVACTGPVCIGILVQGVVEMEVAGRIQGAAYAGVAADFAASASIVIDALTGKADGTLESSGLGHEEGVEVMATAGGKIRIGLGPNVVVWPMPGAPMHTTPMIETELRMFGAARYATGSLLLNQDASNVSSPLDAYRNRVGISASAGQGGAAEDEDLDEAEDSDHGFVEDLDHGFAEDSDQVGLLRSNRALHIDFALMQEDQSQALDSEMDASEEIFSRRRRRRRRRRDPRRRAAPPPPPLPDYTEGLIIEKPNGGGVCGAFSFNVKGEADLFALGLPSALADGLSTSFFKDAIKQAVTDIGENLITAVENAVGDCLGGIGLPLGSMKSLVRTVCGVAGDAIASVVPDIDFKGLGDREIVAEVLFCKELYSVDSNGNCQDLSCAVEEFP